MYFSQLGVVLISVKPLTTEITENKTTPKFCKITVFTYYGSLRIEKLLKTFFWGQISSSQEAKVRGV